MVTSALLALLSSAVPAPGGGPDALYRRTVERSLERAQAELVASIDLFVEHPRWEDPWVVTSEHFEVRTTESYALAAEMARQLEFIHGEWVKLLGPGSPPPGKNRIWIFPNIAAYNQFGQQAAEHSSMYGSFYADQQAEQPVATYYNPNHTWLGMWITHAATHQFLAKSFGAEPELWIAEGLASYFALYWDWSYGARELKRLASGREFVPLERLLSEPIQAYVTNANDRFIELGMLFRYFLDHCEGTKNGAGGQADAGPFRDFLRAALRGQDISRTEFAQTLDEGSDLLESDFKNFDFGAQ